MNRSRFKKIYTKLSQDTGNFHKKTTKSLYFLQEAKMASSWKFSRKLDILMNVPFQRTNPKKYISLTLTFHLPFKQRKPN